MRTLRIASLAALAAPALAQVPDFARTDYPAGIGPRWVSAADLNGDGAPELLVALSVPDRVAVLPALGGGTFGAPVGVNVGEEPWAIAVADVNGDGKLDAVTANRGSDDATVLRGNGAGALTPVATHAAGDGPRAIEVADFDGDGIVDLALGHEFSKDVHVRFGGGGGAFLAPSVLPTTWFAKNLVASDADLDGDVDLLLSVPPDLGTPFAPFAPVELENEGAGTFVHGFAGSMSGIPVWLDVGDLDGDGFPDAVAPTDDSLDTLGESARNNGFGSFSSSSLWTGGIFGFDILTETGELNGDGLLDAVAADLQGVQVVAGKGDMHFTANGVVHEAGATIAHIAVVDVDGDGLDDVVTANEGSGDVSVLINTFCPAPEIHTLTPDQLPAVPPGGPATVTASGCGFLAVTAIEVDGEAIAPSAFAVVDDETLTFTMPLVDSLGPIVVRAVAPGGKAPAVMQIVPSAPPVLVLQDADPAHLFSAGTARVTIGGSPGDLAFLAVSPDLLPTVVPGLFSADIGNGFLSLYLMAAPQLGTKAWAKETFPLTGLPAGAKLHFQAAVLEAATSALPLVMTGVQSGTVLF